MAAVRMKLFIIIAGAAIVSALSIFWIVVIYSTFLKIQIPIYG